MAREAARTLRIRTVDHLARRLRCSRNELLKYAQEPERYFREGSFTDKKGKVRPKTVPQGRLRAILENLNTLIHSMELHPAIHGSRRSRSYLTNAKVHVNKSVVLNLDIRDCFPSITHSMVARSFHRVAKCSPEISGILARISTPFGILPQGAPHSPMVANLALVPLILRLNKLADDHRAAHSQYVDDVTISGSDRIRGLKRLVCKIIEQEGFSIAPEKMHVRGRDMEQVVTGVRVNEGLDVTRERLAAVKKEMAQGCVMPSSLEGKIRAIKKLNPGVARLLERQMRARSLITA